MAADAGRRSYVQHRAQLAPALVDQARVSEANRAMLRPHGQCPIAVGPEDERWDRQPMHGAASVPRACLAAPRRLRRPQHTARAPHGRDTLALHPDPRRSLGSAH